jgi:hypothetical protein
MYKATPAATCCRQDEKAVSYLILIFKQGSSLANFQPIATFNILRYRKNSLPITPSLRKYYLAYIPFNVN